MKKILFFAFVFTIASCSSDIQPPGPPIPPAPPSPDADVSSYLFDAKDQYIGAVLDKSISRGITFYKVRSSKGYWTIIGDFLSYANPNIFFVTKELTDDDVGYLFNTADGNNPFDPDAVRVSNDVEHINRYYARTRVYNDDSSSSQNKIFDVRYFFGTYGGTEETSTMGTYLSTIGDDSFDRNTPLSVYFTSDTSVKNPIKIFSTISSTEAFEKTGFPEVIDNSGDLKLLSFDEASKKDNFPESEYHWDGWE